MSDMSLAIKYRPKTFEDCVEQSSIRTILEHQIKTNTIKHAYLLTGPAGTGKTTISRIFANEINHGKGGLIELDGASNTGVDDVREIIKQAQTQSLDSEYKIFLIDEFHQISTGGQNALLKTLEEPPAKSIFILATTDPQKILKTILSRVQRFNLTKISYDGILSRLKYVLEEEGVTTYEEEALAFITKLAEGGMRDALTSLEKALAYDSNLTIDNVVKSLGTVDYDVMLELTKSMLSTNHNKVIEIIESVFNAGVDLKQFIKQYMNYVLDINKYFVSNTFDYIQIPSTYKADFDNMSNQDVGKVYTLLSVLINLNSQLKWETSVKAFIEATLLVEIEQL